MLIKHILENNVAEGKNNYYNPMDYERGQQRQMDYEKRDFKRQEMEHELGHEDDPDFERKLRQQQMDRDRGPWYLKINGKILKTQGQPKVFDWKKGANNYALAILKNKPELQGKIMLTKNGQDDTTENMQETATAGATSAGHVATLGMNPKLSPGPARGKKSYIGTPGKSGTKAPPQPKVNQPKTKHGTAVNALDMKSNIFGGGKAIKRK